MAAAGGPALAATARHATTIGVTATRFPFMPRANKETRRIPTNVTPIAVDVRGASQYTGFPVATLNGWRTKGGGPPFVKINRSVRYRLVDLENWLADRVVNSTAEVAAQRSCGSRSKKR